MVQAVGVAQSPVQVERWPSERPLFVLVWLSALALWIALAVSLVGILYAAFLGLFFFVAHVTFITHLRGSAVRLGPEQMPELYERVVALSQRLGMRRVPDAYVVQAGGALNALATRFLRSDFIVLYSELLDACGDNAAARDFIVAHELGHLHAGHLRLRWLMLPGFFVPFLGTAYSRACEYTCDRYGFAASPDPERGLDGLCILAAGGKHGPRVNRRALIAQRRDLEAVWMKIGQWLSTHPPIAHRLGVLQPSLAEATLGGRRAAMGAALVLALAVAVPVAATFGFVRSIWPQLRAASQARQQGGAAGDPAGARGQTEAAILSLVQAAEDHRAAGSGPPVDVEQLYQAWSSLHPGQSEPLDPYDGARFGYHVENGEYVIWSTGPDPDDQADDLYYSSQAAKGQ
jgi:Zn-dependent protease with chaperone function